MYKASRISNAMIMTTSKLRKIGVRAARLLPTTVPTYASRKHHGKEPRNVKRQNLARGIFVMPAGNEIYVLTIGMRREKNAVALPHF